MPTPEENLREEFGRLISGYVVQNSILKSENEQLRRDLAQVKGDLDQAKGARDGDRSPTSLPG